jgi:cytochrome c oxidase cbb3-type subunit 4
MKFKTYLEQITGVGLYPMASLLIFFIFFTALSIWALRVNRKYINNLKHIPFNGQE